MKSNLRYSIIIICAVLGLICSSCAQDNSESTPQGITEEKAAGIIENAVSQESQGLTAQFKQVTVFTEGLSLKLLKSYSSDTSLNTLCGLSNDSSTIIEYSGPNRSASYEISWQWTIKCTDTNIISGISFLCSGTGNYDGPKLTSDNELSFNFDLDNLFFGDHYMLEGNYINEGTYHFKEEEEQISYTSILEFACDDIIINKKTKSFAGGYAMVSLTGRTSEENSFKYKGTMIFNTDNTAIMKFGSGNEYVIAF